MCLFYSKENTQKLLKNKSKRGRRYIWAHKIVKTNNGGLLSPFCHIPISPGTIYKSDRHIKKATQDDRDSGNRIHRGIHVFLNKDLACLMFDEYWIMVRCYLKDLVAVGDMQDAVFMRIYIPKKIRKIW
jgi:hypothetical protein